jgi:hypothetical protein
LRGCIGRRLVRLPNWVGVEMGVEIGDQEHFKMWKVSYLWLPIKFSSTKPTGLIPFEQNGALANSKTDYSGVHLLVHIGIDIISSGQDHVFP